MTRKRITILLSVVATLALAGLGAYLPLRDKVRVTDAVSHLPIQGARVVPVYLSMGGPGSPGYTTDRNGIARIGGFGLPCGGYGVYVSAAGYHTNFISTFPTSEKHEGWRGDQMDISLQPSSKP